MCRSIISLSEITHQMWRNYSFIQRNKATTRAEVWGQVRGSGQNLKKEGIGNNEGSFFLKQGLGTLCQLCLVYSKPWHIQNQRYIQNPGILSTLVYSGPCNIENPGWHAQNPRHIWNPVRSMMEHFRKIVNGCNYFGKSSLFLHHQLFTFSTL